MDNQQGPTLPHMELCSAFCASLDGRGICGTVDTRTRMVQSLHGSPETITMLLLGYTPIQNEKLKQIIFH